MQCTLLMNGVQSDDSCSALRFLLVRTAVLHHE